MLAEPRKREKYSINPRGLEWSNDESKLGQQLLMKMGWKKGSALGLNEDGTKEHVKVTAKSDRRGVGCSKQTVDNWIAHQDDFNAILSSLNAHSSVETETFSLHHKSKQCRSRVHYEKFTKGKDLSSYNATDMSSIFGRRQSTNNFKLSEGDIKSVKCNDKEQQCYNDVDIGENGASATTDSNTPSRQQLFVTSSTTIDNYFAEKLAQLHNKTTTTHSHNNNESVELHSKKKKRKIEQMREVVEVVETSVSHKHKKKRSETTTCDTGENVRHKKRKKTKKHKELVASDDEVVKKCSKKRKNNSCET